MRVGARTVREGARMDRLATVATIGSLAPGGGAFGT